MNIDTSTPARRAMHRPATLIQPCGRCMNCQDGKPRQCIRFAQADAARATVNDASTGFERAQAALSAKQPEQFPREPHMDEQTDWPDTRKYMGTCQKCARTFRGDKGRVKDRKCWNCAKPQSEPVAGMAIPEPQRPVGGSLMPETDKSTARQRSPAK